MKDRIIDGPFLNSGLEMMENTLGFNIMSKIFIQNLNYPFNQTNIQIIQINLSILAYISNINEYF